LAAKNVFRLFRCVWVKIPNTLRFVPFFLSQLLLVLPLYLRASREVFIKKRLSSGSFQIKKAPL
ncbi:MAG TPA: hypothetical protein VEZ13_14755, partial [Brevibacillus sp.]|nr:hypothetical protein [Brevibacillus sp.]